MVTQFSLLGSFESNLMETSATATATAVRRLALLSSHLRPHCLSPQLVFSNTCSSDQETGSCIFCQIVRGEAPAFKVYEDDVCLCMLDAYPLCRGHSLIIPKCHFSSLQATPPSVVAAMFSKVPLISSAVMKATGCGVGGLVLHRKHWTVIQHRALSDSFNLLVNNGVAAGQVIFHTHIHIIPRRASDCLWASESLSRRQLKLDQEALKLADSIRDNLPFLNNFEDSKGQGSSLIEN